MFENGSNQIRKGVTLEYCILLKDIYLEAFLGDARVLSACNLSNCLVRLTKRIVNKKCCRNWLRYAVIQVQGETTNDIKKCNLLIEKAFPWYRLRKEYALPSPVRLRTNENIPDCTDLLFLYQRTGPNRQYGTKYFPPAVPPEKGYYGVRETTCNATRISKYLKFAAPVVHGVDQYEWELPSARRKNAKEDADNKHNSEAEQLDSKDMLSDDGTMNDQASPDSSSTWEVVPVPSTLPEPNSPSKDLPGKRKVNFQGDKSKKYTYSYANMSANCSHGGISPTTTTSDNSNSADVVALMEKPTVTSVNPKPLLFSTYELHSQLGSAVDMEWNFFEAKNRNLVHLTESFFAPELQSD